MAQSQIKSKEKLGLQKKRYFASTWTACLKCKGLVLVRMFHIFQLDNTSQSVRLFYALLSLHKKKIMIIYLRLGDIYLKLTVIGGFIYIISDWQGHLGPVKLREHEQWTNFRHSYQREMYLRAMEMCKDQAWLWSFWGSKSALSKILGEMILDSGTPYQLNV